MLSELSGKEAGRLRETVKGMDWETLMLLTGLFVVIGGITEVGIINDISGGSEEMISVVREFKVPYIWTLRGDLDLPNRRPEWKDIDLILDPGFGFIGSPEADYACMRQMDRLQAFQRPILIGVSRKSMVWRPLGLTPDTCLTPTQALQLYAIEHGATILRTHDVKETKQTIELCNCLLSPLDSKM